MNILFVAPKPPNHLHRMRSLNILKALSKEHKVHLICLMESEEELQYFDSSLVDKMTCIPHSKMRSYANCLLRAPFPEPLEAAYCYSPLLEQMINKILKEEKIDLVYVKRCRMARYGIKIKKRVTTILDLTDSMEMYYSRAIQIVEWYRRPLFFEEWLKYRYYERHIVSQYDMCVVASEIDAKFISERVENCTVTVLPNVVDVDFFKPVEMKEDDEVMLLFSGLMNTQANIDAAKFLMEEIFPHIQQKMPDARLYVVGLNPPNQIKAYGEKNPDIIVTGYVPDLRDYIGKSAVVLVPIRAGAGTRNKILQAFSMQIPVVSTTVGAEGILGLSTDSIFVEDVPEKFAEKVVELAKNPDLQRQMGVRGQQLVKQNYSIEAFRQKLNHILQESFPHLSK